MAGFTSFSKKILIFLNILAAIVFLLACLAPYLDPEQWWLLSIIGLGFPITLVIQILFIFLWLIIQPRLVLISLISLLIGWKNIAVSFAFNSKKEFVQSKPKDVLRVVHWNVARFIEWSRNNNEGSQLRLKMMDQLKAQDADVLCLIEFYHSINPLYYDNLSHVMKELGYPYYFYSWDDDGGDQWGGQAIFSRHPIIDSGMLRYPKPAMQESLVHTDILFNTDTVRIYATHLQSVRFEREDYEKIKKIKQRDDKIIENSKNIFSKLKRGFIYRSRQSRLVQNELDKSPFPYIITGDFNDVPNSNTYFSIRKNTKDAFLEKGSGIGRTFALISPTLRIDYILASEAFDVLQFKRITKMYSDHFMLVADLKLN
jgi:endonuclease/exonuclease/phosphatase family metal-dependent hydrolase